MNFLFFVLALAVGQLAWFEDRTRQAGVEHPHHNRSFENRYAEIMQGYTALGASASAADFDGDGYEDLYVTDSSRAGRNRLYRNNGDFTFTDVAERAGVAQGNDARNASANSLWLDYDNDGRLDLLLVRFGQSLLFRNLGGTFQDVTAQSGLAGRMNAICAIAFDYDRDGDLDLFLGRYFSDVDLFDPETSRFFPENMETARNGGGLRLYRNNGDGTFTDATRAAGFDISGWTLDLGHGDADNDGDEDLYVASDFGTDFFFVNNGDGTFSDHTEKAIGFDTKKGMNADWGDFDNDGRLDIYVTNITDDYMREGNFLWRNNGDLTFSDVARETGVHDTGWGWAGKFFDYDNDGWLDLYVVNGWVSAGPESYVPVIFEMLIREGDRDGRMDLSDARKWPPMKDRSLSGYQRMRLFRNHSGQLFSEEAGRHGLDSKQDGRGIAVADFDLDGRLDLFVANANDTPRLYRNCRPPSGQAHWIQFQLRSAEGNRFAVGAQVRVLAAGAERLGFVNGGNGFASQSSMRVHFGLGGARQAEQVRIRWPSGREQSLGPLAANRIYEVREGSEARVLGKADSLYEEAQKARRGEHFGRALKLFEKALRQDPDSLRLGSEYRMTVIEAEAYDRALDFFAELTAENPHSAHAHLNHGLALVDKVPTAGSITQVLLANNALKHFTRSIEAETTWVGLYTRGNSYLFWPKIFNRAPLGVADLEKALEMQQKKPRRSYHERVYVALGDGYHKTGQLEKARETWRQGLKAFPASKPLERRLEADPESLSQIVDSGYNPNIRVDTDLKELWSDK